MKQLGYIAIVWMILSNAASAADPSSIYQYSNPNAFNQAYQQQVQTQQMQLQTQLMQQQLQQQQMQQYQPQNQMPFNPQQSIQPYVQGQHRGWGY